MVFREKLLEAARMVSFGDVYLVPGKAVVDPDEVDLSTRFSRNVRLRIPIASAPMDTVTGWEMAVALALHGGIGVLHRNCSIDEQVEMARRVKNFPPIPMRTLFVYNDEPCERALVKMVEEGVREIPVVSSDGRVLGYARYSDVRSICRESRLAPVEHAVRGGDIYTVDRVAEARRAILDGKIDCVAITDSTGIYLGTVCVREALEEVEPSLDENGRLVVAAAISPFDTTRAKALDRVVDVLVSDVAHFHNVKVLEAARRLVKDLSIDFVAGNVGTYEAVVDTVNIVERVDGFRVGIGGGSICITSEVCGAYVPTLWAVACVRDALHDLNLDIPVIADGGIRTAGDVVKVLAAGASCAMLGYVFAGCEEACAPKIVVGDRIYKPYRGMASRSAIERRFAMDRYARTVKRVAEGVEGLVPYKGPASKVIRELVEGIKAGLGYAGAKCIADLWRSARFGLVSHPKTVGVDLRLG